MRSIEEIIARQKIEETLARYCNHLDSMTLGDLGQLFTEDCVVSFGPNPDLEANGREALIASLARLWRWHRTAHHLCNVVIRFDTTKRATVQSKILVRYVLSALQARARAQVMLGILLSDCQI